MKTAGRYHSLAVNWPKFYPLAVKAMARLRPSCNRFHCSSDAMQPTLTNISTYVFYIYLSAENMYKIKSKIVENNNSKETAWGLTNWFEFGFDRFECFTPKASQGNGSKREANAMYESRLRGGVQIHLPTRVTRSSRSLSTCLRCTEERKKSHACFAGWPQAEKWTVGFKSGNAWNAPPFTVQSSQVRTSKVRFAAVVALIAEGNQSFIH